MRFKCHGCERTLQVRGEPPAGAAVDVRCPTCGAGNRVKVPSNVNREEASEGVRRFMDFIRKHTEGKQ